MTLGDDDLVWYASYGSNCLYARFITYLTGGHAVGATHAERGARNPAPPHRSAPFTFPGTVRFLGDSPKWGGGGVAFLDHDTPGNAPGRRYLITKGQFDDVASQESRREAVSIDIASLPVGVVTPIGDGFYDGILSLESDDGIPVVTFTSPGSLVDTPGSPPSAAYLGTILRGLVEVHTSTLDELVAALMAAPGVAEGWTAAEVAALAAE